MDSLASSLKNSEKILSSEEYYEKRNFPLFVPREEVLTKISEIIQIHSLPAQPSHSNYLEVIRANADLERRLLDEIKKEGDEINSLIIDVKQHTRLVNLHLSEIENNPESSRLIRYSIIGAITLFFVGVIYPLAFLPVDTAKSINWSFYDLILNLLSPKGIILLLVSVTFSSIMIVFWRVNETLKYPIDDVQKLASDSKVENYSEYLKIRTENLNGHLEWRKSQEPKSGQ